MTEDRARKLYNAEQYHPDAPSWEFLAESFKEPYRLRIKNSDLEALNADLLAALKGILASMGKKEYIVALAKAEATIARAGGEK